MTREPMVRLFASILKRDEEGVTWLVTPVEKMRVEVADAHFLVIRADLVGAGAEQGVQMLTNVGDAFIAGATHPIRVETDPETREPRPYVRVRGRLEARILRAPFYEMVEWADEREGVLGVMSQGQFFELGAPR